MRGTPNPAMSSMPMLPRLPGSCPHYSGGAQQRHAERLMPGPTKAGPLSPLLLSFCLAPMVCGPCHCRCKNKKSVGLHVACMRGRLHTCFFTFSKQLGARCKLTDSMSGVPAAPTPRTRSAWRRSGHCSLRSLLVDRDRSRSGFGEVQGRASVSVPVGSAVVCGTTFTVLHKRASYCCIASLYQVPCVAWYWAEAPCIAACLWVG